jgi:type I restriction enzyme S subunit
VAVEELIGPVPDGWEYTTLGAACKRGGGDIQTGPFGSQLHAADYVPTGIPSIMPENIGDNRIIENGISRIARKDAMRLSRYLVRKGDIVYSRRGDVERRALIGEPENGWLCGTGCLRVRLGEKGTDSRYTSYYLGHPAVREWIVRHAHGATMPNLNTSILAACPFVIPPSSEQRAIARVLGTLDDKIELNRRMNDTLEVMARALFKSWFVDFDPVRAKAKGQDPDLPDEIARVFPDFFRESDLGQIPAGWTLCGIGGVADVLSGGTPSKNTQSMWDGNIPWISPKTMRTIHADEAEAFVAEKAVGNGTRLAPAGSTLVMVRGMGLHQKVRVSQARRDVAFNQDVKALVPTQIDASLLLFTLLRAQEILLRRVESSGHGTGRLPTEVLLAQPVVMPDVAAQRILARPFSDMNDRIASARTESRVLATLRDVLLPKLMSGQLRVKDTEHFVGRAV